MKGKLLKLFMALMLGLVTIPTTALVAPGVAHADDWEEMADGDCNYNAPPFGSAGYSVSGYPVWVTVNWQYTGDWTSFCEDINIFPMAGYYWTHGIVKARTYMCNSAGSCWYNAWRNCQGGCLAAIDMADNVRYQVHMYSPQNLGPGSQLYD